jgi:hypothetical protein
MPLSETLRSDAEQWEAEARYWAGRGEALAGEVSYYLRHGDEAAADATELRRRRAADKWLQFTRMAEDCRRRASDIRRTAA